MLRFARLLCGAITVLAVLVGPVRAQYYRPPGYYPPPPGYAPPPCPAVTPGPLSGAARGAAGGALFGAIGGNAGRGAAIGAALEGLPGRLAAVLHARRGPVTESSHSAAGFDSGGPMTRRISSALLALGFFACLPQSQASAQSATGPAAAPQPAPAAPASPPAAPPHQRYFSISAAAAALGSPGCTASMGCGPGPLRRSAAGLRRRSRICGDVLLWLSCGEGWDSRHRCQPHQRQHREGH